MGRGYFTTLMLEDAIELAKAKHLGQKRFDGSDYIFHPLAVVRILRDRGYNAQTQAVAVLHDVLEDTDTNMHEIMRILQYNPEAFMDVVLLTKEKGVDIADYLQAIKKSDVATAVKLADRIHNLSTAHHGTTQFMEKYIKETETHYVPFAKATCFEQDVTNALSNLKRELDFRNRMQWS